MNDRSLSQKTSLSALPAPKSQLAVLSISNTGANGSFVSIGDYVDYGVTITLAEGTTVHPSITVQLPLSMAFALVNISIKPTSANINYPAMNVATTVSNGYNETATVSFPQIVNTPDNVVDSNDQITLVFTALVLPTAINVDGQPISVTSRMTYENGSLSFQEAQRSTAVYLVEPVLTWNVTWNATTGSAGDVIGCTVSIGHASSSTAAAYNIDVTGHLAPYFNLITDSIKSSDPSAILSGGSVSGWANIAVVPALVLGDSVVITFSTTIDNSVAASSVIQNQLMLNYSSAPSSNGFNAYPSSCAIMLTNFDCVSSLSRFATVSSPAPSIQIALLNTSNPIASGSLVTIGEYVTFKIILTVPRGMTTNITIGTHTSFSASGAFVLRSMSFVPPADIIPSGLQTAQFDIDGDRNDDTGLITLDSLLNQVPGAFLIFIMLFLPFHLAWW